MAAGTHAFPTFPARVLAAPPHPTPKIRHKVRLGDTIRVMVTILRLRRRAIHAKHTALMATPPPRPGRFSYRRAGHRVALATNHSKKPLIRRKTPRLPVSVLHSRNPSFTQETGNVQHLLRSTAPTLDALSHRTVGAFLLLRDEQHPRHVPLPQHRRRRPRSQQGGRGRHRRCLWRQRLSLYHLRRLGRRPHPRRGTHPVLFRRTGHARPYCPCPHPRRQRHDCRPRLHRPRQRRRQVLRQHHGRLALRKRRMARAPRCRFFHLLYRHQHRRDVRPAPHRIATGKHRLPLRLRPRRHRHGVWSVAL